MAPLYTVTKEEPRGTGHNRMTLRGPLPRATEGGCDGCGPVEEVYVLEVDQRKGLSGTTRRNYCAACLDQLEGLLGALSLVRAGQGVE
jgi:hypothetical protein